MPRKERSTRRDDLPLVVGEIRRGDPVLCARLAAGNVLRARRGVPRIGPEAVAIVFERYLDVARPLNPPIVLDPCCGNGVILAVLQVVYGRFVGALHGGDADPKAVHGAKANLEFLNDPAAMTRRLAELEERRARTGSERLDAVIDDARALAGEARALANEPLAGRPPVHVTRANALFDPAPIPTADLVITDPPYDRRSRWVGADTDDDEQGLSIFLERTRSLLSATGRIALVLDPAVSLPTVQGLAIEDRVALPRRTGWLLARRREDRRDT